MHPRVIGERNEEARRRIQAAASSLSQTLNIPEMGALTFAEQRDMMVAQMRELEILADVLEFASENAANVVTQLQNPPADETEAHEPDSDDEAPKRSPGRPRKSR